MFDARDEASISAADIAHPVGVQNDAPNVHGNALAGRPERHLGVRSSLLTMCADRALATVSAKRSPDLGHASVGGHPGRGRNRTPAFWSW
jgi:hypothetical protein